MSVTSERLDRTPLGQRIADALRHDILFGRLAPGTKLAQTQVCERFGTSRMPVRDALRQLTPGTGLRTKGRVMNNRPGGQWGYRQDAFLANLEQQGESQDHQIILDAQAFGEGQEHHTLQPVLESVEARFKKLGIAEHIYQTGTVVTADTGFANEANMQYLHERGINGYIPDNRFRSRDPKFAEQKDKYGKRHQHLRNQDWKEVIPASEFQFDPVTKTCQCPAGNPLWLRSEREDARGNAKLFFEGRLTDCRSCDLKYRCLRNPASPDSRKGHGRQVSFILEAKRPPNYTDWMKHRVDSLRGKEIYSHRMSVVEPVFGNIGTNKGLNRFSLRGKKKVQGQWQLYCLVHNIEKLVNYGQLAA